MPIQIFGEAKTRRTAVLLKNFSIFSFAIISEKEKASGFIYAMLCLGRAFNVLMFFLGRRRVQFCVLTFSYGPLCFFGL